MIPVLAVEDTETAGNYLAETLGFFPAEIGLMSYGTQQVAIVRTGEIPRAMLPMRLDHVAFSSPDVDGVHATNLARGARLSSKFTPDGPRDIPEFWESGVRFIFFDGPDGWPFEFCAKNGSDEAKGHSHFAIRTGRIETAEAQLVKMGARLIARHVLEGNPAPVRVCFLELSGCVFEIFDEAPMPEADQVGGWIGLLPDDGG
ncbi:VOC family protein [Tropicimonas sp. TH_r6]|uniref:VOC family protein n=1 Tax=Tropicimonas sp. TH_r6 TaxID=3082085 RepID=UPI0029538071|nr:VOC family protein [Tropicimonas sp. TH_r6]MDV7145873.1 VOC family protein [Tropicimonas sp. TH_r6]